MDLTPEKLDVLRDSDARKVFETVANRRLVLFRELLRSFDLGDDEAARQRLHGLLGSLKRQNLINETAAPVEDFATYYVTADGLSAQRDLRRFNDLGFVPG